MKIALINTNQIRPPISPVGLEYIAEALNAAGHEVHVLDLCWEADNASAVEAFYRGRDFGLTGLTLRNTDDCAFSGRESFVLGFADMVALVGAQASGIVAIGGAGYSVMPEAVLDACGADLGLWGEGEFAMVQLANRIEGCEPWDDLPGLLVRRGGNWERNAPVLGDLGSLPAMTRRWFDNERYFREGGQLGFETKRGCPGACIYCADPVAKGSRIRLRPPEAVAQELAGLAERGLDHLHTCDSEFNIPREHALQVCRALTEQGLGERLRWYAYCAPVPFDRELAAAMRRAGCDGINFGTDSGDDRLLQDLGRGYTGEDIVTAVSLCQEHGIRVMTDLLMGVPGETEQSIRNTVELIMKAGPDCVGVAVGVRVYPGTPLAAMAAEGLLDSGLRGCETPDDPRFFLEPAVAGFIYPLLAELIGDDERFFFFDPSRPEANYNYNANTVLTHALAAGARGAYWDILLRKRAEKGTTKGDGE
jgi:radical SAM superfamily enzyme YgiQ (UPF0313 family)